MNLSSLLGMLIIGIGLMVLISIPSYLYHVHKLFLHLKDNQNDVWVTLGRPHLIINNSISMNITFLKYLLKGRFYELHDKKLLKITKNVTRLFYMSLFASISWLAVYVLAI